MALDYLPSPGWAVIYGETPSASRWSELGENDDALATGAGWDDAVLKTRHLANGTNLKIPFANLNMPTMPLVKVRSNANQTVSNTTGTQTDVVLNTVDNNVGGFSLSSNGVTIPEDGVYLIMGEYRTTDAENFLTYINKNGSTFCMLSFVGRTGTARGYQAGAASSLLSCTAGDVIKLRYENRSFATTILYAQMSIVRVG